MRVGVSSTSPSVAPGSSPVQDRRGARTQRLRRHRRERRVERQPVVGDQGPDQRVAVRVEPGRRQPHDRRRRPATRARVQQRGPLRDAQAEPGQVPVVGAHQPGMLRGLAADQRGAGLAAALGDPGDQRRDPLRVQPPDRDVVEERQRLRAGAHDVVGAHRHEVDPDRVQPPHGLRDRGLGAHAVGRRHDHRLAVARRDRDRAAEPAEPAQHLGPPRRGDRRAHQVDGALARLDVHAGARVGTPGVGHRAPLPIGASRMNLRARHVVRHRLRVDAVEAREAELVVGQVEGGEDAADGEVAQRVGADELADLLDRVGRGDELGLDRRVDAVEARVVDRRGADPEVDLLRAVAPQQPDDLLGGRAAHDRVVDDDQPLVADHLAQRAELDVDAPLAHRLAGLDERPAAVPVADHALAERDARRLREPRRGRRAGVRHGHHEVGLDRVLAGELHAHAGGGPRTGCAPPCTSRGGRSR